MPRASILTAAAFARRAGVGPFSGFFATLAVASCAAPAPQKIEPETAASTGAAAMTEETAPPIAVAAGAIWPPRMPCLGDFEAVPLGKWAEYEESYLDAATVKERVALVSKGSEAITLETTTETRPGDQTVFATVFATGGRESGWRVTSNVFQVADDDPMESPALPPAHQPYPRVDDKKLIGIEMVSVRAGLFKARHYRYRTPYGEQVDFWMADGVPPIGLVKLEAEQKQHAAFRAGFRFELVETGSGATPKVTRRARPFDARLLQQQGMPWTRQARVGPQPPVKVIQ
jgi:hypothetical protein